MELVHRYFNKGIEGIPYNSLKEIMVNRSHFGTHIDSINHGVIILSDNTIIKCVKNYYSEPNLGVCKKDTCFGVLSHFGFKNSIEINNCPSCHARMLYDLSNKNVKRIYK